MSNKNITLKSKIKKLMFFLFPSSKVCYLLCFCLIWKLIILEDYS